jgi:multidrug efflux pump subunit AcrA (membrane-fusion protein)
MKMAERLLRMKRLSRKFITVLLTAVLLTGCAGEEAVGTGAETESIELHTPKRSIINTEPVIRRNLYDATLYEGAVYPYVEEYSFESPQNFGSYAALPGEKVQEGDVLVRANGERLAGQIEELQEKLDELTEEYEKFRIKTEEAIQEQEGELEWLWGIVDNLKNDVPAEFILDEEGKQIENPNYQSWQADLKKWDGNYGLKEQDIKVNQEALRQKKELYELDYSYYNRQLQELKAKRQKETIVSKISGEVVGIGWYTDGSYVSEGTTVIAVADPERFFIKCNYVPWRLLVNAADMYALIGGKRYEVSYLESDISTTTFTLQDRDSEVEMGDYVMLVLMADYREQVLTVPGDSVYEDGSGQIVYVVEDNRTVLREVQTGMSDGIYTEIVSGLEEGEQVVSHFSVAGGKEAVLERQDRQTSYTSNGFLYYPLETMVENPVENGTVSAVERLVSVGEYVEKGQVLLSVTVNADEVETAKRETGLRRAKERLADLEAKGREADAEAIAEMKEKIAEQEKAYAEIKADSAVTEICAPDAGYVQYLIYVSPGDIIEQGENVASIADDRAAYMALDTRNNKTLNYGDVLTVKYMDPSGVQQTMEGRILTMGALGSSEDLLPDMMLMEVPEEARANMEIMRNGSFGPEMTMYIASGYVNIMENVVIVPAEAVTDKTETRGYVNVVGEDGSVTRTSFLYGQMNSDYYWVIDGLTEGMKICWE